MIIFLDGCAIKEQKILIEQDLAAKKEIFKTIQKVFTRSPVYRFVMNKAKSESVGPKGGMRWDCTLCKKVCAANEFQVDHLDPVIPINRHYLSLTIEEFYERVNTSDENLRVLCKTCHKEKSWLENKRRREFKKCTQKNLKT
jgi:5-methylcytosine-specific restriction endonuclease McrA